MTGATKTVERHPGPFSGPDAELARAIAMAVIPWYGNDDGPTHQRIMKDGIWNDHIAVQAALAAIHHLRGAAVAMTQPSSPDTERQRAASQDDIDFLRACADALRSPDAAATPSEPVAWRYQFVTSVDGKEWSDWFIVDDPKSIPSRERQTVQPLYLGAAQPERKPGFFAGLTPEQQKAALEYDGPENHGDPAFAQPSGTLDPATVEACARFIELHAKAMRDMATTLSADGLSAIAKALPSGAVLSSTERKD